MTNLNIYRHRDKYKKLPPISPNLKNIQLDQDVVGDFWNYARERMNIYHRKIQETADIYTSDPVLAKYKFCNVYRELDRQTIYIHTVLQDIRHNLKLWLLNIILFRCITSIQTHQQIGLHHIYDSDIYLDKLKNVARPKYGTAYIFPPQVIRLCGYIDRESRLAYHPVSVIDKILDEIQKFQNISIVEAIDRLIPIRGVGMRFHLTEIMIDLAYQYSDRIDLYKDFHIGPGAMPSIRRLNNKENPVDICRAMIYTQPSDFPYLQIGSNDIYITAEGIEGLCCEFRKYTNLKNGYGRKRLYHH